MKMLSNPINLAYGKRLQTGKDQVPMILESIRLPFPKSCFGPYI